MAEIAVPRATRAEASGVAIARSEPNTRNSTIPAVMMPRPVPPMEGWLACWASWPATAIWTPLPDPAVAVSTNCFAREIGRSCACWSSETVAKATEPSEDTCWAPSTEYGEMTFTTCGSSARLLRIAATRCCTAGAVTFVPPEVPMTTCSESPDRCGATDWIRSSACVDSVCGNVKLFE